MLFSSEAFTTRSVVQIVGIAVLVIALVRITLSYLRVLSLRRKLPPGPFPLPLFGNYLGIPKSKPWIKWEQLAVKYNYPLTTIWNGSRPTIVCNDAWSISELFEKRANIYSSRPHMVMMGDCINATNNNQVALKYNDQWRLHRRLTADWEDDLPYVQACADEILRWRTVTILGGIPHAPIQDDTYDGYLIPKDTWVVGNVWAIHRNPRDYPEPDEYRPERFFGGLERPHPSKKGHNAFGWGRRQCSGQPLAEQGLFMTIARMLWAFNIKPGLDKDGKEVKLDIFAYTDSENMRPEPFKARFLPRTAGVEKIIRADAAAAREALRQYDGESKLRLEHV